MAGDVDGFVPQRPVPKYFIDPNDMDDVGLSQAIAARRQSAKPVAAPAGVAQPVRPVAPVQAQPVPSAPVGDSRPNDPAPVDDSDGLLPAPLRQQAQQRQQQQVGNVVGAPTKDQTPMGRMQLAAGSPVLSTPRPTDKNAAPGAHHGIRKFGDVMAGLGMGILTHNPVAGMRLYDEMSSAPLRKQQAAYDAQHATSEDTFSKAKDLATAETNESKVEGMKAQYEARAGKAEAETENLKQKFNPDTYQEDPNSPTGWTAERFGTPGKREQADPPAVVKANAQSAAKAPTTYEATVTAANLEKDPTRKAALMAAAKQMEESERRKFAAGNGRQPTEAELWKQLFVKDNGREPTADEFATRKKSGANSDFKNKEDVVKWDTKYYHDDQGQWDKERRDIVNSDLDDKSKQAQLNALDDRHRQDRQTHEQTKGDLYKQVGGGHAQQPHQAQNPAQQPNQNAGGKQYKPGDKVRYKGQDRTVQSVNPDGSLVLGQ